MTMRLVLVWLVVGLMSCRADDATDLPDLGPRPAATAPSPLRANIARNAGINPRLLRRFRPLEPLNNDPSEIERLRVQLGKQLFHDKRLSQGRDTSCATCHPLDRGGADGLATSRGTRGRPLVRNTPTVFNAAWHIAQFWDGRAHSLDEQARSPMLNPSEMGMSSADDLTSALRAVPAYVSAFAAAFPGERSPTDIDHAATAIAAFERTLMTPSRWDSYLRGDAEALTAAELEGLKLFADVGCVQCHTGELVGGSMFQRVGVAHPWPNQNDLGRYAITHDANDRMVFKVPSLRNVAITGPYFHDGQTRSLADAVRLMAKYQLDVELSPREVDSIVRWLSTLTGAASPDVLAPPQVPPG